MHSFRFGIAQKLFCVCLAFSVPIVVMLVLMTNAKLAEIDFGSKEILGDRYQRPLERILQHISRHRRLWARSRRGDASVAAALAQQERAVDAAIAELRRVDLTSGAELQFTPNGLGLRKRQQFTAINLERSWRALRNSLVGAGVASAQAGYLDLIARARTMITHAGDTSNLILDPDLDSYYLMDVTLLALPQMEDRLQQIAMSVEDLVAAQQMTADDNVKVATMAAFLQEADWDRVVASTKTALNEDPNFYGVSPSLAQLAVYLDRGTASADRLISRMQALAKSDMPIASLDVPAFRAEVEALHDALYAFHAAALDQEDTLLRRRIAYFEGRLHLGFALAAASVLLAALLAYALAANIVRRTRRISATTDAFAKGDMKARVAGAGSDELGGLADSFDSMATHIGTLTAEVRQRADELAASNDNLEHAIRQRTRELETRNLAMSMILDHVHEGMLTVDLEGTLSAEHSAILDTWLGKPEPEAKLSTYLGRNDPVLAADLELGFGELRDDVMPLELILAQLPQRIQRGNQHMRLSYIPITEDNKLRRLLVIITDISSEIESRRGAAVQEETLRIFQSCQRDRSSFVDYFIDARDIVGKLTTEQPLEMAETKRLIHTLKGNSAIFGVLSLSELCHEIENNIAENGDVLTDPDVAHLKAGWERLAESVRQIIGDDTGARIELDDDAFSSIVDSIANGVPRGELLQTIAQWKLEPAERQFSRFVERAQSIAKRLGKQVEVRVEAGGLRLCRQTWSPLWSTLVHAIRNAIDHGIESPAERTRAGKPAAGQLLLRASVIDGRILIDVKDDGRGLDWDRLADAARKANLPSATRRDLIHAALADGISTRETVTDTSGRGVGMAALRHVCDELGGSVELDSEPGAGTLVRCSFPATLMGGQVAATIVGRPIQASFVPVAHA